jgi:methylated-DNA-[protein]-cysteine S-methyltransferase
MIKQDLKKAIETAKGTDFQKKVWKALLTIPKGEVRTYSWVATKIGTPKAVRAVGSAVAKNPLAPKVPCHRVIRKDGSLGGYSGPGGLAKKKQLLKKEGG